MSKWEIRGLFGNEYSLDNALLELKDRGLEAVKIDRRNLSVILERRDEKIERIVKRILEINHGFVEHEGKPGSYEKALREQKIKKLKKLAKEKH